jgi:hypothetical protein
MEILINTLRSKLDNQLEKPAYHGVVNLEIAASSRMLFKEVDGLESVYSNNSGFRGVLIGFPTSAPGHQAFQSSTWLSFSGCLRRISLSI